MKLLAIRIEEWRLPMFKKALGEAGFSFVNCGSLTKGRLILTVETNDVAGLAKAVQQADAAAAKSRLNERSIKP